MGSSPKTTRLQDRTVVIVRPRQAVVLQRSRRFSPNPSADNRPTLRTDFTDLTAVRIRMEASFEVDDRYRKEIEGGDDDLLILAPRA
jgi:hypothetical protein